LLSSFEELAFGSSRKPIQHELVAAIPCDLILVAAVTVIVGQGCENASRRAGEQEVLEEEAEEQTT
jgi:hypothetical protein